MKYLFDSSVIIAALIEVHPFHIRALPWMSRAKKSEFEWFVAAHSVAETYSVLTKLPLVPRISASTAWKLISENLKGANLIALTSSDYLVTVESTSKLALTGVTVYDAIIMQAAKKAKVDRIVTFNGRDFERLSPHDREMIHVP